jgi:hypothetical protein
MKTETILKGVQLMKQLDSIETAKELISSTSEVVIEKTHGYTGAKIRLDSELTYFENASNMPSTLLKEIRDETIKHLQRIKRLIETEERRIKDEIEDI